MIATASAPQVSAEEAGPDPEADKVPQVPIDEHIRRLVAEGEATSVSLDDDDFFDQFRAKKS